MKQNLRERLPSDYRRYNQTGNLRPQQPGLKRKNQSIEISQQAGQMKKGREVHDQFYNLKLLSEVAEKAKPLDVQEIPQSNLSTLIAAEKITPWAIQRKRCLERQRLARNVSLYHGRILEKFYQANSHFTAVNIRNVALVLGWRSDQIKTWLKYRYIADWKNFAFSKENHLFVPKYIW